MKNKTLRENVHDPLSDNQLDEASLGGWVLTHTSVHQETRTLYFIKDDKKED